MHSQHAPGLFSHPDPDHADDRFGTPPGEVGWSSADLFHEPDAPPHNSGASTEPVA